MVFIKQRKESEQRIIKCKYNVSFAVPTLSWKHHHLSSQIIPFLGHFTARVHLFQYTRFPYTKFISSIDLSHRLDIRYNSEFAPSIFKQLSHYTVLHGLCRVPQLLLHDGTQGMIKVKWQLHWTILGQTFVTRISYHCENSSQGLFTLNP